MVANETVEQKLARAKGYPYSRPDTSFLFVAGDVLLFDNANWHGLDNLNGIVGCCGSSAQSFAAARGVDLTALSRGELYWPVLAIGSNAGPEQLRRKYPRETFGDAVIPVVQVELDDFDVVYTPYLSSYGSCTATLEYSPGTTASIFITYLTEPLMQRMHATEGGYNLCRLSALRLVVAPAATSTSVAVATGDGTPLPSPGPQARNRTAASGAASPAGGDPPAAGCFEVRDWVYQYNHKLGCINLPITAASTTATPVSIAEIPVRGRAFPAATQVQMLAAIREAATGPDRDGPLQPVPLQDLLARTPSGSLGDAGDPLDRWILTHIDDPEERAALCARLARHALPFSYVQSQTLEAL